jgi:pyridoxamine 5'-phosphate oxidase-like protein
MTRPLGDALPDALLPLLNGRDLPGRMGKALLIATTDARGWPHLALLSYGEVVAVDRRRIRLATYRESRTSGNLRRDGKLTLCLVEAGMAYYIKAQARIQRDPMAEHAHLTCFEAVVEAILEDQAREDLEPGAGVTSGITFRSGRPCEEVLRGWQAMLDGLRRAG